MIVEDGREAEGGTVVPDPDIGELRLETEIGVVELGLEPMAAFLVVDQRALDGQDADAVPALRRWTKSKPMPGFCMISSAVSEKQLDGIGRRGIRGDGLEFEVEERVLGPEAAGEGCQERGPRGHPPQGHIRH